MSTVASFGEAWEFYPCTISDASYSVRFNVDVLQLSAEQRDGFPHTVVVTLAYESRTDGFPAPGEFDRINRIEDGFTLRQDSLRHVGVLTGQGTMRYVFCGRGEPDALEENGRHLMSGHDGGFSVQVFPDDNFGYFDTLLAPGPYDWNWIKDRQVCESLEQHGDTLTDSRQIDFYIYAPSQASLDTVVAELEGLGLVEAGRNQGEDGRFGVELSVNAVPDLRQINDLTVAIMNVLEGTDATFDGWGCPVLK